MCPCRVSVVLVCLRIPLGIGLVIGTDQVDICDGISSKCKEVWGDQFPNVTTEQTLTHWVPKILTLILPTLYKEDIGI